MPRRRHIREWHIFPGQAMRLNMSVEENRISRAFGVVLVVLKVQIKTVVPGTAGGGKVDGFRLCEYALPGSVKDKLKITMEYICR